MSNRKLTEGRWFNIETAEQYESLLVYGRPDISDRNLRTRVQIGSGFSGPGRYMLCQYKQRCPRNCCDDTVNDVLTADEVILAAIDEVRALTRVIRQARGRDG